MPTSRRSSRRPYHAEHVPLDITRARGGLRYEQASDGDWTVRSVMGDKPYRCPGCNQQIDPGTQHVVAWRRNTWQGEAAELEARRHWHPACWSRRY